MLKLLDSVGQLAWRLAWRIFHWQVADRSLLDTGDVPITLEREKREEATPNGTKSSEANHPYKKL